MKMNVNGNFKDNLMGKKKVIFIICLIFAVALIAAILHMVSGGGKDSAKNIYYADKVSVITGNGSGTVNRFAGVVEAQDTLKISLSEGQKVKEIFGGLDRSCILKRFREDLERARKLKARYVVFHVSDVSARELFTYQCRHTDEEVIDAAAELINLLLDGENYTFDFLMENLWWPGLTMTRPEMTKRLLSQVHYQKKGIMLDTGHLMHMNLELKTQDEAVDYILEKVAEHGNLASYIKGMHLNQSITGAYVKTLITKKDAMPSDYEACSKACYEHVFQIDQHLPFTTPKVQKLVETIKPEYLTHELMSYGRSEHEIKLVMQRAALKGKNL